MAVSTAKVHENPELLSLLPQEGHQRTPAARRRALGRMDDQPSHNLARLHATREDDEPDDDPCDGPHAGFVNVLMDHVQLQAERVKRRGKERDKGSGRCQTPSLLPATGSGDFERETTHQVSDNAQSFVEHQHTIVNLDVLPNRVVERLQTGFRPEQFRRVCVRDRRKRAMLGFSVADGGTSERLDAPRTFETRLTSTLNLNSRPVSLTASFLSSPSVPVMASSLGMYDASAMVDWTSDS